MTTLIPDLVHALVESLDANAGALGRLSEGIYYDHDHEFGDFSDRYGEALTVLERGIGLLSTISREMDEQSQINRERVDPKLVAARRALRDIARGAANPTERAESGLAATFE